VARFTLDVKDPHAFGALVRPDSYMEMRWHQQEAMREVPRVFEKVEADWMRMFGRRYGAVESYRAEDAELLLVTSGTVTSTARFAVDRRREAGEAIGLVKVKMFRPFPTGPLREALSGVKRVAVLDRNISPGHCGIFAEETRAALYDLPTEDRPDVYGYIIGLGGRDVTPAVIDEVIDRTRRSTSVEREDLWVGVNP
jgi:pyruvate/2-oxoacid:ferredoxin oxidoreductase alpha subunit